MRKLTVLFLTLCVFLSLMAASRPKLPIRSFSFEANIRTIKTEYKVEDFYEKDGVCYYCLEEGFSDMLFDDALVKEIYSEFKKQLPRSYRNKPFKIVSKNYPIEDFIPNYKRKVADRDSLRYTKKAEHKPVVMRNNLPYEITAGLQGRGIALWNSHGYYYNAEKDSWQWQRPKLFGTVEDMMTTDFVIRYLMPMLRNAGAEIFMPRERDLQLDAVNLEIENRFDSIVCRGKVQKAGLYWLKLFYTADGNNVGKVACNVSHAGAKSSYTIDGSIGQGTWIYVDQIYIKDSVTVSINIAPNNAFCLDSIRVGGGYSSSGSGKPAYAEGARYFLQSDNVPDSILYCNKPGRIGDYYDDLYSRARWVNHLMGGSEKFPEHPGLGIPLDAVIAIHTDASQTGDTGIEGTLVLCTADSIFPTGQSRLASNDFAYYMAEQIAADMGVADGKWSTRGIWHRLYVETRVPQVPANIVEMWSHNSFNDVLTALDPSSRFTLARAVYKAATKYLAAESGSDYVIQPLPVQGFAALLSGDSARLSWRPQSDPHEPTALPTAYVVYTRVNDGAFDNGVLVEADSVSLPVKPDSIYSYKITAVNSGGESFPSETLALCKVSGASETVLVANCFDRLSGPESFANDSIAGFLYEKDFGVPYQSTVAYTGRQFQFNRAAPYEGNDNPGFGGSMASPYEATEIAGNSFDYPYIHGKAIAASGRSFVSCSKAALMSREIDLAPYKTIDAIFGKQRNSGNYELFPPDLQKVLYAYLSSGNKLVLSGAYLASEGGDFAKNTLKFKLRAPWEAQNGVVLNKKAKSSYLLYTQPNAEQYFVQSVESFSPVDKQHSVLLQYGQSHNPAALGHSGKYKIAAAGFPIEAVQSDSARTQIMQTLLDF